jgi:hypothetical protein
MHESTTTPGPFTLHEEELRSALRDEDREDWIAPFDPMNVSADELHNIVDDCLGAGIIERPSDGASLAIYPNSMSDPERSSRSIQGSVARICSAAASSSASKVSPAR